MFRGVGVGLLLATAGLTASVPPAEPVVTVPLVPKLDGTTWRGDGVVAPTVYLFDTDGVLQYSYNGKTYRNGTWRQNGDTLYWESNGKYCQFEGKIQGEEINGRAWNVAGGKWVLSFKLQRGKNR